MALFYKRPLACACACFVTAVFLSYFASFFLSFRSLLLYYTTKFADLSTQNKKHLTKNFFSL